MQKVTEKINTTVPSTNGLAEIAGRKAWRDGEACAPHSHSVPEAERAAWRFGWMSAEQHDRIARTLEKKWSAERCLRKSRPTIGPGLPTVW